MLGLDSTEKDYKSYAFAKEDLKKAVDLGYAVLQYITDLELEVENLEGELENAKNSDQLQEFKEEILGKVAEIEDYILSADDNVDNVNQAIRELMDEAENAGDHIDWAKKTVKEIADALNA